jgi:hypothetical protein
MKYKNIVKLFAIALYMVVSPLVNASVLVDRTETLKRTLPSGVPQYVHLFYCSHRGRPAENKSDFERIMFSMMGKQENALKKLIEILGEDNVVLCNFLYDYKGKNFLEHGSPSSPIPNAVTCQDLPEQLIEWISCNGQIHLGNGKYKEIAMPQESMEWLDGFQKSHIFIFLFLDRLFLDRFKNEISKPLGFYSIFDFKNTRSAKDLIQYNRVQYPVGDDSVRDWWPGLLNYFDFYENDGIKLNKDIESHFLTCKAEVPLPTKKNLLNQKRLRAGAEMVAQFNNDFLEKEPLKLKSNNKKACLLGGLAATITATFLYCNWSSITNLSQRVCARLGI